MATKDIHHIDNWLIRTGWLALAGLLFAQSCTGTFDGTSALGLVTDLRFGGVVAGAVVLLLVGYAIRSRENRVLAVWNILEHATEVSVAELQRSTGFTREFLDSAVRTINRQPGSYYVWDDEADVIVDGRMRSRIVLVERCQSCGAHVNAQLSLDLPAAPACAHCGAPVATGDLNRLKLDRVEALREKATKGQRFSVLLFIVLLLVFWPAAVAYAVWASGAVDNLFKSA